MRRDPDRIKVTTMRAAGLCLFLASCATTAAPAGSGGPAQAEEGEGEIELLTVVAEKGSIPELKSFFHFGKSICSVRAWLGSIDQRSLISRK